MKLFLVAIIVLVAYHQTIANISEWDLFKLQFDKIYASNKEEDLRKQIYNATLEKIVKHNQKYINGIVSFEMGINQFADLTDAEYEAKLRSSTLNIAFERSAFAQNFTRNNLTDYVNWVEYGYKNKILNQGDCENAYIFAAVAALEGQYFIKHGQLIQLSHQELLDCSKKYGSYGCEGGFQRSIYEYILHENLGYAANNLYLGHEDTCRKKEPRISISTFYEIPNGDEQALKQAVASVGPIPIDIDASLDTFRYYKNGVYYDSRCRTNGWLSHSSTVVGYGNENGKDYWLVRNSWGYWWGDGGYIKMARNKNNHCGVATRAVYPIVY